MKRKINNKLVLFLFLFCCFLISPVSSYSYNVYYDDTEESYVADFNGESLFSFIPYEPKVHYRLIFMSSDNQHKLMVKIHAGGALSFWHDDEKLKVTLKDSETASFESEKKDVVFVLDLSSLEAPKGFVLGQSYVFTEVEARIVFEDKDDTKINGLLTGIYKVKNILAGKPKELSAFKLYLLDPIDSEYKSIMLMRYMEKELSRGFAGRTSDQRPIEFFLGKENILNSTLEIDGKKIVF